MFARCLVIRAVTSHLKEQDILLRNLKKQTVFLHPNPRVLPFTNLVLTVTTSVRGLKAWKDVRLDGKMRILRINQFKNGKWYTMATPLIARELKALASKNLTCENINSIETKRYSADSLPALSGGNSPGLIVAKGSRVRGKRERYG